MPDTQEAGDKTAAGKAFASPSILPTYARLPRAGERDAIFGLSRSALNNLVLPCKANGFRPPIRSISLKQPHTVRGTRLIVVASALEYFRKLEAEQTAPEAAQAASMPEQGHGDHEI